MQSGLVELHRHLDGSLRTATVHEFATSLGIPVPDSLHFEVGMGLTTALAKFAFTISLLQRSDHLARVADEMCSDAAAEGIEHLEIRFAPQMHTHMTTATAVDAVLEGCAGRAGLILCGLYGEPPGILESHVELATTRSKITGIDLAGGPLPSHQFTLRDYESAFTRARSYGLGRTVHAGEGRPPTEIAVAVEYLHAQRIGHGVTLLDDPRVLDLVLERHVAIEACPTSNVHTGVIASIAAHPLRQWLSHGVRVAICTDNPLFSNVDLPTELLRVQQAHMLTQLQMEQLKQHAHSARFESP